MGALSKREYNVYTIIRAYTIIRGTRVGFFRHSASMCAGDDASAASMKNLNIL